MNRYEKMREALVLALSLLDLKEGVSYKIVSQKDIDFMKAALAEPARNYEVGTAEEQFVRFGKFCNRHFLAKARCDKDCPCYDFHMSGCSCCFLWAQMPYEEGR